MYVGDVTAPGVANCLIRDAYCLAIDQIVAGTCTRVATELAEDGIVRVAHNGSPLGIAPRRRYDERSEMEAVAETLAACAERAASDYVKSHVCKIGITALNFLCERFELHNFRDGQHYMLGYDFGNRSNPVQTLKQTSERGVEVRFKLDPSIIKNVVIDLEKMKAWFASLPLNSPRLEVLWVDRRGTAQ